MFSARSATAREPSPWARVVQRARAAGRVAHDLTQTNPTRLKLPYDEARILAALSRREVMDHSPDPFGLLGARRAVAARLASRGPSAAEDSIVLTASTSEAYSLSFKLLCDPGDEVLVPTPSYPLFEHLARLESVIPVPYPLVHADGWHVDLAALEARVTRRSRAVVLVSPNNPTGSCVTRGELERVAAMGLPLLSDEVFAGYLLEPRAERAASALEARDVLTLALGGLSKEAALPQVKLAWIAVGGPRRIVAEALGRLEVAADAYLSPSASAQIAAAELLECPSAPDALRERCRENLAVLRGSLRGGAASVLPVEGGWTALVRLPAVADEDEWMTALLEEDGVLVQPGWLYDLTAGPHAVVSLATAPGTFAEASSRIAARVERATQAAAG